MPSTLLFFSLKILRIASRQIYYTQIRLTSTNFWNDDFVETSSNTFSARGKCSMNEM